MLQSCLLCSRIMNVEKYRQSSESKPVSSVFLVGFVFSVQFNAQGVLHKKDYCCTRLKINHLFFLFPLLSLLPPPICLLQLQLMAVSVLLAHSLCALIICTNGIVHIPCIWLHRHFVQGFCHRWDTGLLLNHYDWLVVSLQSSNVEYLTYDRRRESLFPSVMIFFTKCPCEDVLINGISFPSSIYAKV